MNHLLQALVEGVLKTPDVRLLDMDIGVDQIGQSRVDLYVSVVPEADNRCPYCGNVCPRYDTPKRNGVYKEKSWRSLDWGQAIVLIKAFTHRIVCPEHGVVVASVPWAYHSSCFTKEFDKTVAWKALHTPKNTISKEMRITWPTVGRCISRVRKDVEPDISNRSKNLTAIGIDETSIGKHHKYITIVVNHSNSEVLYIKEGHSQESLDPFFESLSEEERLNIKYITADGAKWIRNSINRYVPHAVICIDCFHVVKWVNEQLEDLRKSVYKEKLVEIKNMKEEMCKLLKKTN